MQALISPSIYFFRSWEGQRKQEFLMEKSIPSKLFREYKTIGLLKYWRWSSVINHLILRILTREDEKNKQEIMEMRIGLSLKGSLYIFLSLTLSCSIISDQIQFPVLYSKKLFLMCYDCSHSYAGQTDTELGQP